jgi:hypothetical protein
VEAEYQSVIPDADIGAPTNCWTRAT